MTTPITIDPKPLCPHGFDDTCSDRVERSPGGYITFRSRPSCHGCGDEWRDMRDLLPSGGSREPVARVCECGYPHTLEACEPCYEKEQARRAKADHEEAEEEYALDLRREEG